MLSTSPNQVGQSHLYTTLGTYFFQQTCQNIARTIKISNISLVHCMHGWAIPPFSRIMHQVLTYKNNRITALQSCR